MVLGKEEILELLLVDGPELLDLMKRVCEPGEVTYSRNVFIPLTRACRNRCGYCTFRSDSPTPPSFPQGTSSGRSGWPEIWGAQRPSSPSVRMHMRSPR